jgi:hypothetical protein
MYKRCIISEPYWNNIGIIKVYETDEQECKPSYPGMDIPVMLTPIPGY